MQDVVSRLIDLTRITFVKSTTRVNIAKLNG